MLATFLGLLGGALAAPFYAAGILALVIGIACPGGRRPWADAGWFTMGLLFLTAGCAALALGIHSAPMLYGLEATP